MTKQHVDDASERWLIRARKVLTELKVENVNALDADATEAKLLELRESSKSDAERQRISALCRGRPKNWEKATKELLIHRHYAECVRRVKTENPGTAVEALTPDLGI